MEVVLKDGVERNESGSIAVCNNLEWDDGRITLACCRVRGLVKVGLRGWMSSVWEHGCSFEVGHSRVRRWSERA
jgi:hypothetical protein